MNLVLMAALLATVPILPPVEGSPSPRPNVTLSGIRLINCDRSSGSGFVIDENVLATAAHVADDTNCKDGVTGAPLTRYYEDKENDFALMVGTYPKILALKYSCQGYNTGEHYDSYGISSHYVGIPIFRQYRLIAADDYTNSLFVVQGTPMPNMRHLRGYIIPGLSGGPVAKSLTGEIVGINNVNLRSFFGLVMINETYSYELKNTILCKR